MLAILGGGVAGLSAAIAARRRGLSFQLFEATGALGGNARTFVVDGFRFDAGAHRLHDRDAEVTSLLRELLGPGLQQVDQPSRVRYADRYVDFPLGLWNVVRNLPVRGTLRAGVELLRRSLHAGSTPHNFEDLALQRYGRTIAEPFLLRYSEKLWGLPASELSVEVAGRRLAGLGLRDLLRRARPRPSAESPHLEGNFLYPRDGIGSISDAMAAACPPGSLALNAPVTAIEHDGSRVRALHVEGHGRIVPEAVISTIPLERQARLLQPQLGAELCATLTSLRSRHVVLIAMFLRRASVSRYASTYFPERQWPFTRIHEPTVRSRAMAPNGCTSLIAECPCFESDALWRDDDAAIAERVVAAASAAGMLGRDELVGTAVRRLSHAYPVLSIAAAAGATRLRTAVGSLRGLHLVGRAATFRYLHIHDLVRAALECVAHLDDMDDERLEHVVGTSAVESAVQTNGPAPDGAPGVRAVQR